MENNAVKSNKSSTLALTVTYTDRNGNVIELDKETMDNYLVTGENKLTEKEYVLAMQLCKMQQLNPWTREVHIIKYGSAVQLVTSYEVYVRRAQEAPSYRGHKSGIVVERQVGPETFEEVYKVGSCIASRGEKLIGGWCTVKKQYPNFVDECTTTVNLSECIQKKKDGTPNDKWASSPCSMIEKVAVSRALRLQFKSEFENISSNIEFETASPNLPGNEVFEDDGAKPDNSPEAEEEGAAADENGKSDDLNRVITKEERAAMFALCTPYFSTVGARNDFLAELFAEYNEKNGKEITSRTMTLGDYNKIVNAIVEKLETMKKETED